MLSWHTCVSIVHQPLPGAAAAYCTVFPYGSHHRCSFAFPMTDLPGNTLALLPSSLRPVSQHCIAVDSKVQNAMLRNPS